jgi:hypothetical protein
MLKFYSMKTTILQDIFVDVSTFKCKHAKKLAMDRLLCVMKTENILEYLIISWSYL